MPHRLIWLLLAWLCAGEGPSAAHENCEFHERHGFIRAHMPAKRDSRGSEEGTSEWPNSACSWSIEAPVNQTVRVEVVSIARGSRLFVHFRDWEGEVAERAVLFGNGTANLTWRVAPRVGATQTLEVFFDDKGDSPLPQEDTHNETETSAVPPTHTHTKPTTPPTHTLTHTHTKPTIPLTHPQQPSKHTHTHTDTHAHSNPDLTHTHKSQFQGDQAPPPAHVTHTPTHTTHPTHTHIHTHTLSQLELQRTHSHTPSRIKVELNQNLITHTHSSIDGAHTHTPTLPQTPSHTHTNTVPAHTHTHTLPQTSAHTHSPAHMGGFQGDALSHSEGRSPRSISHLRGVVMETTPTWTGRRGISKLVTPPLVSPGNNDITGPQPVTDRTGQTPLEFSEDSDVSNRPGAAASGQPGTSSRTQSTSTLFTSDITNHTPISDDPDITNHTPVSDDPDITNHTLISKDPDITNLTPISKDPDITNHTTISNLDPTSQDSAHSKAHHTLTVTDTHTVTVTVTDAHTLTNTNTHATNTPNDNETTPNTHVTHSITHTPSKHTTNTPDQHTPHLPHTHITHIHVSHSPQTHTLDPVETHTSSHTHTTDAPQTHSAHTPQTATALTHIHTTHTASLTPDTPAPSSADDATLPPLSPSSFSPSLAPSLSPSLAPSLSTARSKPRTLDPSLTPDQSFGVVPTVTSHPGLPMGDVITPSGTFRMHTLTDGPSQSDDSVTTKSPAHPTALTHTNTHTPTDTHLQTETTTHTNTYTPTDTHLQTETTTHTNIPTEREIHAQTETHTHTQTHTDTHSRTETHTHTQTHTDTQTHASSSPPPTNASRPHKHIPIPSSHSPSPHTHTHTPLPRPPPSSAAPDWSHRGRVFIEEDQPPVVKVESFQLLLQVLMEENCSGVQGSITWMEPFLQRVKGYQNHHLIWSSGCVVQSVVVFQTAAALCWMKGAESLLQEAGLAQALGAGLTIQGVHVKNITIGGLQGSVCDWLLECKTGFECVSIGQNSTCRSACHAPFCHNHGICVHHRGQQPSCRCPVGEDFWYMGQRCDVRMTRQRLVGVCFAVVVAIAIAMALLCYLVIRRFKALLIQAKVDQTRSSYRRFNHFDELSARYWSRSLAESGDSLDNPAFSRSDELLHLRARQRTCCYHDDTLSVCSTWQGSAIQLNTIYGSQYGWDMSNYSLADAVVDSGKASDLSVCSWPIEPIQWTPFPLLQQLHTQNTQVRSSRPRSYCEGMELVDLERTWSA